ncbi:unnamed protein product, partial [Brassica oleracea]
TDHINWRLLPPLFSPIYVDALLRIHRCQQPCNQEGTCVESTRQLLPKAGAQSPSSPGVAYETEHTRSKAIQTYGSRAREVLQILEKMKPKIYGDW